MPSCTVPTFSKIEVTFCATQPAMLAICQAMGMAIATVPTGTRPCTHSSTATAPVLVTSSAFVIACTMNQVVINRSWRWKALVWSSTPSRMKSSSWRARAKSFTVRILV
jgi:hypothetical protein